MSIAEVLSGKRQWWIETGDCLEALMAIPPACVDGVVTDPPYSSGGMYRGDRNQRPSGKYVQTTSIDSCRTEFSGDNRDQRSFLLWGSLWLGQCLRAAKRGGVVCVFTDWRQLPTMTDAIQCGGWVWRNVVTWWEPGVRMQRGRFSSSSEFVVYGSSGVPSEGELSPQNVITIQPIDGEEKDHIAEKPVDLMAVLLGVTPAGAVVLDPFCGSGTTGVACLQTGRRFIGIEIDPHYADLARKRLANTMPLFDHAAKAEQQELFNA